MPQYIQLSLFDQVQTKHCPNCNRDLPATLEFWHRSKNKRGEPSLAGSCKDCARARATQWADDHPEKNRKRARDWYWADPERARDSAKRWHDENPDKVKAYRARNQDRIRAYKQSPEQKAKDAEYRKRKAKQLREYNRQYRATHPGWQSENMREWRRNNPEQAKANIHRRLARKQAAPGDYTADDAKRMYIEQDGMCAYCGIRIFMGIPKDVHVDHVRPLSRGGSNYPDNLLLTCQPCNQSKGNRTVAEWVAVRGW